MDEQLEQELSQNAWEFLRAGKNEDAINALNLLVNKSQDPFHIFNRGTAYLALGKYDLAIKDFMLASSQRGVNFITSGDYIFQGVCHWYLNDPCQTVSLWKEALNAPYTDAAGGIEPPAFLFYAGLRQDDISLVNEAFDLLIKHKKQFNTEWPVPVASFLTENIGLEDFINLAISTRSEELRERRRCELEFYIGISNLKQGDFISFKKHMTNSYNSEYGFLQPHFYLARWEIQKNFPAKPFT